jgi:hypothetical protein
MREVVSSRLGGGAHQQRLDTVIQQAGRRFELADERMTRLENAQNELLEKSNTGFSAVTVSFHLRVMSFANSFCSRVLPP